MNQEDPPTDRRELLHEIMDELPVLISYIDAGHRYRFNNRTYETWFGIRREDLIGQHLSDVLGEAAYEKIRPRVDAALAGKRVTFGDLLAYQGAGPREVEIIYQPDRAATGTVSGIYALIQDVTESRRGDRIARFLSALSETVRPLTDPDEIMRVTAEMLGTHLGADRCAYAEVAPDESHYTITGDYVSGVASMVGDYVLSSHGETVQEALRRGETLVVNDISHDERTRDSAENYHPIEIAAFIAVPLIKHGRLVAGLAVHQKVTRHWIPEEIELVQIVAGRSWESIERARVTRDLHIQLETNALFRAVLDSANDSVIITEARLDPPGPRIEYVNPAFTLMTGYAPGEAIGQTPRMLQGPQTDRETLCRLRRDLDEFQRFHGETINYTKDRRPYIAEWHITPLHGPEGKVRKWVAIQRDVTDRRRSESDRENLLQAEQNARAEAERMGRAKDEFLATLSHELRTPLNAILGWTQLLTRSPTLSAEVKRGLEIIERNAIAQTGIIEDLLDMSRVIGGKVRLNLGDVAMSTLVESVVDSMRPLANDKGLHFEFTAAPGPATVHGDAERLRQVVWNLLSNAIKFTPPGGAVSATIEEAEAEVRVVICDTGVGIEPEFLPFMFERFRQADASSSRMFGGLGLGLSIAKQLIELHQGSIVAASNGRGHGAVFTVILPRQPAITGKNDRSRGSVGAGANLRLDGVSILVVDDDLDARELSARLLGQAGAETLVVGSALEALAALDVIKSDVIVSDIGMPGMDGYEFIRRVRSGATRAARTLPAVALTAFARAEDEQIVLKAGYNVHVSKPLDPVRLVHAVASAVGLKPEPGDPSEAKDLTTEQRVGGSDVQPER